MPCYTRREVTVNMAVADFAVLAAGLRAAGLTADVDAANRTAVVRSRDGRRATLSGGALRYDPRHESIVNEIKRAYSHEVVRVAAKKFGWKLTATQEANVLRAGRKR